jgi:Chaperone of endosialidase
LGSVLWGARFIVISNGFGATFSTVGYFDITCPTSGTITGVGGHANVTATAAGITMGAWDALYYILPAGSNNTSLAANFRIASYTAALDVPHTWLLLAVRNGDDGTFNFCNGMRLRLSESASASLTGSAYPQYSSLGVGTAASATTGEIRATNEITAYYSSDRNLKTNIVPIENALVKLKQISGVMFDWTDEEVEKRGGEDGYFVRKHDTGVIAQDVEVVLPEVVATRADGYKAVKYEKLAGLIIQSINELADQVEEIKKRLN